MKGPPLCFQQASPSDYAGRRKRLAKTRTHGRGLTCEAVPPEQVQFVIIQPSTAG